MRKLILLVIAGAAVFGVIFIQGYIAGGNQEREIKSRARDFGPRLHRVAKSGGSEDVVHEIVGAMADEVDGVNIDPESVEVFALPIEVGGEGKYDCPAAPFPPELKKLSTLDQGAVKNLVVRCRRDVSVVGFRATAVPDSGDPFPIEGWTYARSFE
jgi:hypothetical protein